MLPVLCLSGDPRQFGLMYEPQAFAGRDALIVAAEGRADWWCGQRRSSYAGAPGKRRSYSIPPSATVTSRVPPSRGLEPRLP